MVCPVQAGQAGQAGRASHAAVDIGPQPLTFDQVVAVARQDAPVRLTEDALAAVAAGRAVVEALAADPPRTTASPPASARWPPPRCRHSGGPTARLTTGRRGVLGLDALLGCLTHLGHRALGWWPDAGRLAIGARADLVSVRLDSVRTVASEPEQVVFAAAVADVDTVVVDGQAVVRARWHRLGDVAGLLAEAIERVDAAMAAGCGDAS